jgi:membrane-associated protease RseP (regulator of RpoE activity)
MDQEEPEFPEAEFAVPAPRPWAAVPLLRERVTVLPADLGEETTARPRWGLPIALFLATCLSTFYTGVTGGGRNLQAALLAGLQYSSALMGILLAHEMGHFLQSVRYRIPATLPLFIPMPLNPIGTMGAVILQRSARADRKAMFDIAISGPLAGLALAIPALIVGMSYSHLVPLPKNTDNLLFFGEPLMVKWLVRWKFGTLPPGWDVTLHPLGMAGSWGIFITALNLIPISQLDGGHILYTLLGKPAQKVAWLIWLGAVAAMLYGGMMVSSQVYGWSVMLFLVWMIGVRHPPTSDDSVPLGGTRIVLGWLTLLFFVIGFTPFPIY